MAPGDFDGDGFDDLVVGVPFEGIGGHRDAGAVQVLFGSGAGLSAEGNEFWDQDSPGILGVSERSDAFGYSVASGDFDGDGFDDLAVGVPYEGIGAESEAGAAQVLFGSGVGPSAEGNQFWHRDTLGILGDNETDGFFGSALAGRSSARNR